jgi:hypothetical protein
MGRNVAPVFHQRAFTDMAAQDVEIELVIQTRGIVTSTKSFPV